MRFSKHVFVTVLTALAVGLSALPATADINDTGTLSGTARMGKTFWSENDCDKTGDARVVGEGLYLAGSPRGMDRERQGAWHIATEAVGVALGLIELEMCGWLGPWDGTVMQPEDRTSGFGPACGASKGHHGMGQISTPAGSPILKLMDLGWKDNVGDVLLMTGKYQEYVADGSTTKRQKFGAMVAQVVASPTGGPADCLNFPGAQRFNVTGTFELVNTGDTKPPKQPDKEMLPFTKKECKETDPNQDKIKDTTARRPCPTARK